MKKLHVIKTNPMWSLCRRNTFSLAAFSYVLVEVATTDITQVIMMMVTGMEMGAATMTMTMAMTTMIMGTAAMTMVVAMVVAMREGVDSMGAGATGIRKRLSSTLL